MERFGADAHRLHAQALGTTVEMLVPWRELPAVGFRYERDPEAPRLDAQGLVFLVRQGLATICAELARRGAALAALQVRVPLEDGAPVATRIEPAEPSLDEVEICSLVRLRLETLALGAEPAGLELEAESVRATQAQLSLFAEAPKRDPKAADRALARLRAEFGEEAVVRMALRAGHLPEARFRVERLLQLPQARPDPAAEPRLLRRILRRPVAVAGQRAGPDGWMPAGVEAGPVRALHGPYLVSGGWWTTEQRREYHFAEMQRGGVLWLFHDRSRRRWYLHGSID
jgi:protein ImuB